VEHHHASGIEIPFIGGRTQTQPLSEDQRWKLARRLLHDPTIAITDRVAGLFILLYAQPLAAVARLTADRVRVDDAGVHVLFGDTPVRLVEPVAALVAKHLQTRRSRSIVGRRSPTPWLFPGAHPDRHRSESHLAARLKRLGIYPARAATARFSSCLPSSPRPSSGDFWASGTSTGGPRGQATPGPTTPPPSSGAAAPKTLPSLPERRTVIVGTAKPIK
jgi:hypothetical protein